MTLKFPLWSIIPTVLFGALFVKGASQKYLPISWEYFGIFNFIVAGCIGLIYFYEYSILKREIEF